MMAKLRQWVPLGVAITALCGLLLVTLHLQERINANDPQIQMSEDVAENLSKGLTVDEAVPADIIDLSKSLAPFVIIYNDKGEVISGNGMLNGVTPQVPKGVLDYAKTNSQNRVTWQPRTGVRLATVTTPFKNDKLSGYVLVGRSLREVEARKEQQLMRIVLAWGATMVATLLASVIFYPGKHS